MLHPLLLQCIEPSPVTHAYIEKTSKELSKNYRVRVATSDGLEQIIIFSQGAMRIPASDFLSEVDAAENEIREFIKEYNR